MMKRSKYFFNCILFTFVMVFHSAGFAQLEVGGDFRLRWYHEIFKNTRDDRGGIDYTRLHARINSTYKVSDLANVNVEVTNLADTSTSPARGISGTGPIHFVVSQLYGELVKSDFYGMDLVRLRAGRQQFSIGNGLSFGESYYYYDKFDGGRIDLSYNPMTLTVFGAIYGQDVSSNGLWPEAPADKILVGKIGANVYEQELMAYGIANKPRGAYNDSYIIGGGSAGSIFSENFDYFFEGAYQKFNQPPGGFEKSGIGYMLGGGYRFSQLGPFRSIRIETNYAAFQGDDPKTEKIEQFSPPFPDFQFGERNGFVNEVIGGDYPHRDKNLQGTKIWYSRLYFIPKDIPRLRVQFQFTTVNSFEKRADGYQPFDNEWQIRLYYSVTSRIQFEFRYAKFYPNDSDKDVNGNGVISSLEDRYSVDSYMTQFRLRF